MFSHDLRVEISLHFVMVTKAFDLHFVDELRDFLSEPISASNSTVGPQLYKGKNTAISASALLFASRRYSLAAAMFMHFSKTAFTKVSVSSEKRIVKKSYQTSLDENKSGYNLCEAQVLHSLRS